MPLLNFLNIKKLKYKMKYKKTQKEVKITKTLHNSQVSTLPNMFPILYFFHSLAEETSIK